MIVSLYPEFDHEMGVCPLSCWAYGRGLFGFNEIVYLVHFMIKCYTCMYKRGPDNCFVFIRLKRIILGQGIKETQEIVRDNYKKYTIIMLKIPL